MSSDQRPYDLAVIGAGLNGAGIARDAALRGLRVVIIEQYDLCTATSAWASRLIHGGLRYLEYGELGLVHESLRERITLRRIAAHLVRPLRICIPIYEGAKRGPLLIRLGMIAYDMLSVGKTVPRHDMLSRKQMLDAEPGLASAGLRAAASPIVTTATAKDLKQGADTPLARILRAHGQLRVAVYDYSGRIGGRLLSVDDVTKYVLADDFLWTVRFHLHELAGGKDERLTFDLQPEIAARDGG